MLSLTKKGLPCSLSFSRSLGKNCCVSRFPCLVPVTECSDCFPSNVWYTSFMVCSNVSTFLLSATASFSISCSFLSLDLLSFWSSSNKHSIFSIWSTCFLESFNLKIKRSVGQSDSGILFYICKTVSVFSPQVRQGIFLHLDFMQLSFQVCDGFLRTACFLFSSINCLCLRRWNIKDT